MLLSKKEKATANCVISPLSRLYVWWVIVQKFVFVGWHFLFWIRVAYGPLEPSLQGLLPIEFVLDTLFFLDVISKFFTGIPHTDTEKYQTLREDNDNEEKEYDYIFNHRVIALYYIKTTFFIDIVSLIPYFLYWPITKYGIEEEKSWWVYFYYLKVVRLLFSRSINHSIDTIFTKIGAYDQSYTLRFKNYMLMLVVYMKFIL